MTRLFERKAVAEQRGEPSAKYYFLGIPIFDDFPVYNTGYLTLNGKLVEAESVREKRSDFNSRLLRASIDGKTRLYNRIERENNAYYKSISTPTWGDLPLKDKIKNVGGIFKNEFTGRSPLGLLKNAAVTATAAAGLVYLVNTNADLIRSVPDRVHDAYVEATFRYDDNSVTAKSAQKPKTDSESSVVQSGQSILEKFILSSAYITGPINDVVADLASFPGKVARGFSGNFNFGGALDRIVSYFENLRAESIAEDERRKQAELAEVKERRIFRSKIAEGKFGEAMEMAVNGAAEDERREIEERHKN